MTFRSQSRAQALLLRDGLVRTSAIRMRACGLTILGEGRDTCCVAVAVGRPPEKVKEFCSAVSYGVPLAQLARRRSHGDGLQGHHDDGGCRGRGRGGQAASALGHECEPAGHKHEHGTCESGKSQAGLSHVGHMAARADACMHPMPARQS